MPFVSLARASRGCVLLASATLALVAFAGSASAQTILVIPPVGDDTSSSIAAISADGSTVVGTSSRPAPYRKRGFKVNLLQGATPTALPPLAAGQTSLATAVSCDGSVIGGQSGTSTEPQAVIWANGQVIPVGFLAPAGTPQRSSLINGFSCDATRIVGQAKNASGALEGFFAGFVGGTVTQLSGIGYISSGPNNDSSINAISQAGIAVGRASWANAGGSGFAQFSMNLDDGSGPTPVGLDQGFGTDDTANDVTPDGSVIVGAVSIPDGFGGTILVPSRTVNGAVVALPPCDEGSGSATGVSDDGRVVVGFNDCLGPNRAFVWDPVNGYRLIEDILRDAGALPPGFSLTIATGISGDGTVIVGNGVGSGFSPRGWVAVIPRTDGPFCPACAADYDDNGGVDGGDLAAFFVDFESGESCADVDANGGVDGGDLAYFFLVFEQGGCDGGRK